MSVRITSRTRRVMTALDGSSFRSLKQICNDSGLRRGTVDPLLDRLIDAGLIEVSLVGEFRLNDRGRKAL